jgi:hypothetical protein
MKLAREFGKRVGSLSLTFNKMPCMEVCRYANYEKKAIRMLKLRWR